MSDDDSLLYIVYFTDFLGENKQVVEFHSVKWAAAERTTYLDRVHNKGIDENDPNQRKFFAMEPIRVEDVCGIKIKHLERVSE